jgi:hypothetical protein
MRRRIVNLSTTRKRKVPIMRYKSKYDRYNREPYSPYTVNLKKGTNKISRLGFRSSFIIRPSKKKFPKRLKSSY